MRLIVAVVCRRVNEAGRMMGFRFRRSLKLLPGVRLNLGGSGHSVSLGGRVLRHTIGPKGMRTTIGLPGRGLSWTDYSPHSETPQNRVGQLPARIEQEAPQNVGRLALINSKSVSEINAVSTSDIVPFINRAQGRYSLLWLTAPAAAIVSMLAIRCGTSPIVQLASLYVAVFIPLCLVSDRYRRSIRIDYDVQGIAQKIEAALKHGFKDLMGCKKVWNVTAKGRTEDLKRNAGASQLTNRVRLRLRFGRPPGLNVRADFPSLQTKDGSIYFLPDAMLFSKDRSCAALNYRDIAFSMQVGRFIEEDALPGDALVVGETWKFLNKNGGPDRRFNGNRRLPVCAYGEMEFKSDGGLNCLIQYSKANAGDNLAKVIQALAMSATRIEAGAIKRIRVAQGWPIWLFCLFLLTSGATLGFAAIHQTTEVIVQPLRNEVRSVRTESVTGQTMAPQLLSKPNDAPLQMPVDLSPRIKPKQLRKAESSVPKTSNSYGSVEQCIKITNIDERVDCLEQLPPQR